MTTAIDILGLAAAVRQVALLRKRLRRMSMERAHRDKLRRYAFLTGYSARNADEHAEMVQLRRDLLAVGIDTGWEWEASKSAREC